MAKFHNSKKMDSLQGKATTAVSKLKRSTGRNIKIERISCGKKQEPNIQVIIPVVGGQKQKKEIVALFGVGHFGAGFGEIKKEILDGLEKIGFFV